MLFMWTRLSCPEQCAALHKLASTGLLHAVGWPHTCCFIGHDNNSLSITYPHAVSVTAITTYTNNSNAPPLAPCCSLLVCCRE